MNFQKVEGNKKCTKNYCELTIAAISAEIPSRPEHHYIVCGSCGNVMVAKIDTTGTTPVITHTEQTPEADTDRTRAMILECKELFDKAGEYFGAVKLSEKAPMESLHHTMPVPSNYAEEKDPCNCSECPGCGCHGDETEENLKSLEENYNAHTCDECSGDPNTCRCRDDEQPECQECVDESGINQEKCDYCEGRSGSCRCEESGDYDCEQCRTYEDDAILEVILEELEDINDKLEEMNRPVNIFTSIRRGMEAFFGAR